MCYKIDRTLNFYGIYSYLAKNQMTAFLGILISFKIIRRKKYFKENIERKK